LSAAVDLPHRRKMLVRDEALDIPWTTNTPILRISRPRGQPSQAVEFAKRDRELPLPKSANQILFAFLQHPDCGLSSPMETHPSHARPISHRPASATPRNHARQCEHWELSTAAMPGAWRRMKVASRRLRRRAPAQLKVTKKGVALRDISELKDHRRPRSRPPDSRARVEGTTLATSAGSLQRN